MSTPEPPSPAEFRRCVEAYRRNEKREVMYDIATFLVKKFWGKSLKMVAAGLGVFLLTWNQGFYRYGYLDLDKLADCIRKKKNREMIKEFRSRDISSLTSKDGGKIRNFFAEFLEALKIKTKDGKEKVTPVGVAKALHLLAPKFFPLWDDEIAANYHCSFNRDNASKKYLAFCQAIKSDVAEVAENAVKRYPNLLKRRTLIKLMDEYNYAKYSKGWCKCKKGC